MYFGDTMIHIYDLVRCGGPRVPKMNFEKNDAKICFGDKVGHTVCGGPRTEGDF